MSKVNNEVKFKIVNKEEGIFMLTNVRISYPNLYRPGKYQGVLKTNLDCSFLIPRDQKKVASQVNNYLISRARTLNSKITKMSQIKDPKFELAADKEHYVLKTTNQLDRPSVYINSDGCIVNDALTAGAEQILYAGAYAGIKIQVNPDNGSGKVKVWTNLVAIQRTGHGEKFGIGTINDEDAQDGFDEVKIKDDFDDIGSPDGFDDDGLNDDDLNSNPDDDFDNDDFDLD